MNSKRALQLISTAGYYGAERVLLELALYLQFQGWDSRVGVFKHTSAPIQLAEVARAHNLPVIEFPCTGQFDRTLAPAIAAYLQREQIQILHTHGYKADIYAGSKLIPATTRRVSTCHNWLTGGFKLWLYQRLDLRALRKFDRIVAVSPPVLQQVLKGGVRADRALIIENGLSTEHPSPETTAQVRAEFCQSPNDFLIMQIGRLSPEKGNNLLLSAFAKAAREAGEGRRNHLVFAGDGPEREKLESLSNQIIANNPSATVHFAGYRTDVPALLAACDLFVISSHYEGLPTVLLEAMAAGKAIIATHVGMIPKVLRNGEAGILIPPGDEEILTMTLTKTLREPEAFTSMREAARHIYSEGHSREAMGAQYEALYRQVLA